MPETTRNLKQVYIDRIETLAKERLINAAEGFSGMLGVKMTVDNPRADLISITDIPFVMGGPENDAVGIYLQISGELQGHILLLIPYNKAIEMVDLLLDEPIGTTQKLGSLERSALAEVGNLTGTFFINAISNQTGFSSRPSPPVVIVDMVGAILDIITALAGAMGDDVLMFHATFMIGDRQMNTDFWVLPDADTLNKLVDRS